MHIVHVCQQYGGLRHGGQDSGGVFAGRAGRKLILNVLPIAKTGTSPGSAISLVLLGAMLLGLALSLWGRDNLPAQDPAVLTRSG